MQHGSHVAVAVAGSLSSDLTPSLGTSYASGAALERKKKKKERRVSSGLCVLQVKAMGYGVTVTILQRKNLGLK